MLMSMSERMLNGDGEHGIRISFKLDTRTA